MRLLFAVCGLPLMFASAAFAAHPLATDDAGTQGPAGFEAEFNGALTQGHHDGSSAVQGVSLHVGLTQTVDLGVNAGYEAALGPAGERGMGDPSLDLKWRIVEQAEARPAIGLRVDYKAPQHSPVSSGTHDGAAIGAAAWDFDERFVYANGSLFVAGLGAKQSYAWAASAAYGERVADGWYGVFDVLHESSGDFRDHTTAGLFGVQWQQRDGMTLSAGGGPTLAAGNAIGWMATVAITLAYAPKEVNAEVAKVD